ncbi:MAG: hypothetical protein CM15mP59_2210 [Flavobacteriaceae bacterium]|nr:MAG: hypothetical protein CM15mP59_2210 [Flavobacteriaceae bacterium]
MKEDTQRSSRGWVGKAQKVCRFNYCYQQHKLREVYGDLGFKQGFAKADEVLANASRGIAEVITHHYTQNIDLRDAKTVLADSGTAIMGSATAKGPNRGRGGSSQSPRFTTAE